MKLRSILLLTTAFAAIAFAQNQRVDLLSVMSGFGKGKTTFQTRQSTSGFEVEVEAEGENLRPNTTYVLNLGAGKVVKNVRTNSFGAYHWARRTIGSNQPMLKVGDLSVLKTTTGVVVQAGKFKSRR